MRGKWVLAAAAVLALVVGGFGGLSKAFAGVGRWMGTTSTVTKMCVYVDRTDGGASYGDLSVLPKYNHRTCIVGKRGPAGASSIVTWNATVATPSSITSPRPGNSSHSVDLAKVGPFTVRGYCYSSEGVGAVTDVISAQDGSSFAWDDSVHPGNFNSGSDQHASNPAHGSTQSPGFATEYGNGEFSVSTADQKTAFTGWATNGVYIQGSQGPACSFIGHLVIETQPAP